MADTFGQQVLENSLLHRTSLVDDGLRRLDGFVHAGEDFGDAALLVKGREQDSVFCKIRERDRLPAINTTVAKCIEVPKASTILHEEEQEPIIYDLLIYLKNCIHRANQTSFMCSQ
jgi:hypothetical protein